MTDVGRPPTEVYRQSIEKLPRAVWRARRRTAVHVLLAMATLIAFATLIPAEPEDAIDLALILATLGLFASPYFLWRAGRRVRRYWNAFELSIGAESMRVAAKGAGRVSIRRDEVSTIIEDTDGLDVLSRSGEIAQVPTTVEGYGDARARLGAWAPIRWRIHDVRWGALLVGFALLLGGVLLRVRQAGSLAIALLILHLDFSVRVANEIRANPHLSRPRKVLGVMIALGSTGLLLALSVMAAFR
jgi:hypothetical protein